MSKDSRTVRIVGDGTWLGTRVEGADGELLSCQRLDLSVVANQGTTLRMDLGPPGMDVTLEVVGKAELDEQRERYERNVQSAQTELVSLRQEVARLTYKIEHGTPGGDPR